MYAKLFTSMYDGTLAGDWKALVTFQQLLILCDRQGVVDMTSRAITARTGIPIEIIESGLTALEQPDKHSRTPDCEGRRIDLIDAHRPWGWRIVNYAKYRDLVNSDQKRAADRQRIAAKRAADRGESSSARREPSLGVADVAQAEGEGEAEAPQKIGQRSSAFDHFWSKYPRKVKKKDAQKVWATKHLHEMLPELLADIERRTAGDRRWVEGFICDPTTYLRGERWNDAVEPPRNGDQDSEAGKKEQRQILDLASLFGIKQGQATWDEFAVKVLAANERRLKKLEPESPGTSKVLED
jgi:hypothetical protein